MQRSKEHGHETEIKTLDDTTSSKITNRFVLKTATNAICCSRSTATTRKSQIHYSRELIMEFAMQPNEVTGQAMAPSVPVDKMDEQQLTALAKSPDATFRMLRSAKKRCDNLISEVLQVLSDLETEKRGSTDQNDRTSIDFEMRGYKGNLIGLQNLKEQLNQAVVNLNTLSDAETRGARLLSRTREHAAFGKKLSALPKEIERKAMKARSKAVMNTFTHHLNEMLALQQAFSNEACDAFLKKVDSVAMATIEASGSLREDLLSTFREAVKAFELSPVNETTAAVGSSAKAE